MITIVMFIIFWHTLCDFKDITVKWTMKLLYVANM